VRTTIDLDDDVLTAVNDLRRPGGPGLSRTVNDLLRRALAVGDTESPFTQRTSGMGRPRLGLDDVGGLLDIVEGDDRG
jgi:Arc/MetJ family transcription regulator